MEYEKVKCLNIKIDILLSINMFISDLKRYAPELAAKLREKHGTELKQFMKQVKKDAWREPTLPVVGFWKPRSANGFLSQWYNSSFVADGVTYANAEQWMMVQKALTFNDPIAVEEMMQTNDPARLLRLGRLVKNYDEDVWNAKRYRIVLIGNLLKFTQNSKLAAELLSTDQDYLVEASATDRIWGVGTTSTDPKNWKGDNLLGKILMIIRGMLAE